MQHEFRPLMPSYLASSVQMISSRNDANDAHARLRVRCVCGSERLVLRYTGLTVDGGINPIKIGENVEFAIVADCTKCRAELPLFDLRLHGYGPAFFQPRANRPCPTLTTIWKCGHCGASEHDVEIVIGWVPFDEVAEEFADRPDFDERLWIEAFETIQIHLRCPECSFEKEGWVELEVV